MAYAYLVSGGLFLFIETQVPVNPHAMISVAWYACIYYVHIQYSLFGKSSDSFIQPAGKKCFTHGFG